jgi:DHA1 family bicyclomycin/chloramphenicol resistance-like MFS transporter
VHGLSPKAELGATDPQTRPPWRLISLLIAITAVGPFSLNIVTPALPSIAQALHTDFETVALILSLYLVAVGVAQPVLGALSDRFGRRPVLIVGFTVTVLTSFAAMFTANVWALIAVRTIQAFGASTGIVMSRAIIRDLYHREQAASMIGYVTMVIMVVPMIVPWFGGILAAAFGWEAIFACMGLMAALVLAWIVYALPETLAVRSSTGGFVRFVEELRALLTSRSFIGYVLCCATGSALFFAFLGGAPHIVVTQMGRSSIELGLWFASGALGYMFGNYCSARWSQRYGVDAMVLFGTFVGLFGAAVVVTLTLTLPHLGPVTIFLPQFITAFGNGLLLPNSIAGAISVRPQAAGTASGITGFMQMAVGAAAAQLVSNLVTPAQTAMPMALVILSFAVLCLILYVTLVRRGTVESIHN